MGIRKVSSWGWCFPKVGTTVLGMGNSNWAVNNIRQHIKNQDRSYAWLSRETGIPYKRILAEVKNETRPISLETTLSSTSALGVDLDLIVGRAA